MDGPLRLVALGLAVGTFDERLYACFPVQFCRLKIIETLSAGQRALDLFLEAIKDVVLEVSESHRLALSWALHLLTHDHTFASDVHELFHEAPRRNRRLTVGTLVFSAHLSAPVLKTLAASDARLAVRA